MSTRIALVSPQARALRDDLVIAALCRSAAEVPESLGVANAKLAIYDTAQAKWWNDAGNIWQVAKTTVNMTEFGVDAVGLYTHMIPAANHGLGTLAADTELVIEVERDDTSDKDLHLAGLRVDPRDAPVTEETVLTGASINQKQLLYALRIFLLGNQEISDAAKQHIFFKDDNVTTAFAFYLKDATGLASAREVFVKERV